jgi:hypothetical protein
VEATTAGATNETDEAAASAEESEPPRGSKPDEATEQTTAGVPTDGSDTPAIEPEASTTTVTARAPSHPQHLGSASRGFVLAVVGRDGDWLRTNAGKHGRSAEVLATLQRSPGSLA